MLTERATRISTDIDLEAEGKQVSWLRLPYSSNVSAYGWIGIPMAVIGQGSGPRVLFVAGNHGDEFEGQVALVKLIRRLQAQDVSGRVVVLPAVNLPAALAGTRLSPLDGGNLNRSFPGDSDGTPTQMIAHYLESVMLPACDAVVDLHSGGNTLEYIPGALVRLSTDAAMNERLLAALRAFRAPIGYVLSDRSEDRMLGAAAERCGVLAVSAELGGAGGLTPNSLQVAEHGIQDLLEHFGSVAAAGGSRRGHETQLMEVGDARYYVYAPAAGLFEPYFRLGDEVRAGQAAGVVHFIDDPLREPVPAQFALDGTVVCRRPKGRVERGDCVAHLATDLQL